MAKIESYENLIIKQKALENLTSALSKFLKRNWNIAKSLLKLSLAISINKKSPDNFRNDVRERIQSFATQYPNIIKPFTIYSINKRDLSPSKNNDFDTMSFPEIGDSKIASVDKYYTYKVCFFNG